MRLGARTGLHVPAGCACRAGGTGSRAGFSLGGYTAAALLGARLAVERMMAVLDGTVPMPALPEFPDLPRALAEHLGANGIHSLVQPGGGDFSDDRVEAAFLICP